MRWTIATGVLVTTVALLVPTTPATAQAPASDTGTRTAAADCQVILYTDVRELVTIDLATAPDTEVELLANQLLAVADAEALGTLAGRLRTRLEGAPEELRAFLQTRLRGSWTTDLRIAANRAMVTGGPRVRAAAQVALDAPSVDPLVTFLNHGIFLARAEDSGTLDLFTDLRGLVTIDLETATDNQVQLLGNQILAAATADRLPTLPGRLQTLLGGPAEELRVFLRTRLLPTWSIDLRIAVNQTVHTGGTHVRAAGQEALDTGTVDALVGYLNHGLYIARARDCAL